MVVAFLFNSSLLKSFYGHFVQKKIFTTGVLQTANRNMIIAVGDVLTYGKDEREKINDKIFLTQSWQILDKDKLQATYPSAIIYAWVIENITEKVAEELHQHLISEQAYIGVQQVDYSYGHHLYYYRTCMILKYRVHGDLCNLLYPLGSEDAKDHGDLDEIKGLGFENVSFEDSGARKTIYDNFDNIAHFEKIKIYCDYIAEYLPEGKNGAGELALLLEDLNPNLFYSLSAGVKAIERAQSEEEWAQVGISIRRYLEQLTDVLFPSKDTLVNGRSVDKTKYINRLKAYLDEHISFEIPDRDKLIKGLGKEIDRLFREANAILHANIDAERTIKCFADLSILTTALLNLTPEKARNPYYGYRKGMIELTRKMAKNFLEEN